MSEPFPGQIEVVDNKSLQFVGDDGITSPIFSLSANQMGFRPYQDEVVVLEKSQAFGTLPHVGDSGFKAITLPRGKYSSMQMFADALQEN